MPFVLEGIVTTRNSEGRCNIAPMGPMAHVQPDRSLKSLIFRPFPDSTTCRNLLAHPEGVFHVTDNSLLFAQAVAGDREALLAELLPARKVQADRLSECCRWYEFRITQVDQSQQRTVMQAEIVHTEQQQEWLGFNRAQFAVIEAAILMTRVHLLGFVEIERQMQALKILVEKTAGPQEQAAFDLLKTSLHEKQQQQTAAEKFAAAAEPLSGRGEKEQA